MIRYLLVLTFILLSTGLKAQEKVTLNGYVKDIQNGEELIGVTVYIPQLKAGTVTNAYGFYSITVTKGTYDIQFSFIGYRTITIKAELLQDESRIIQLESEATMMEEVVVEEKPIDANVVDVQMSRNTINMDQIKKTSSFIW